jgi:hypothetical protein
VRGNLYSQVKLAGLHSVFPSLNGVIILTDCDVTVPSEAILSLGWESGGDEGMPACPLPLRKRLIGQPLFVGIMSCGVALAWAVCASKLLFLIWMSWRQE